MVGKKRRIKRIIKNGRSIILPIDHGITKPEKGVERIDEIIESVGKYIDAVVLHKGIVKNSRAVVECDVGLIIHLSASTALSDDPNDKRLVTSVEKAVSLGADAVSVHVNIGSRTEGEQLERLGMVSERCDWYGMPLLAMMYPRGKVDVTTETVSHAARVGYEMGADIVKVPYTSKFEEVTRICKVPVVVAGGSKGSEYDLLKRVEDVMRRGAAGVAVGRNVFSSEDPVSVAKALHMIVHGRMGAEEVMGYEGSVVVR